MIEVSKRPGGPSRRIGPASLAALVIMVVGVTAITALIVLFLRSEAPDNPTKLGWIGQGVALLAFLLSGAAIVSRQPRNVVGWLLVIPGVAPALSELLLVWLAGIEEAPASVGPGLWLAIWFTNWSWILLIFPIFGILLTFPDGRLLSPRWRWVVVLGGVMTMTMLVIAGLSSELAIVVGDEELMWSVPNPIGLFSFSEDFDRVFSMLWSPALLVMTVASVAAVVIRFRRGDQVEREQLKWPMAAVLFFGIVYGVGAISGGLGGPAFEIPFGLSLAAIPISVAISVLKYRLYEIDRIISRTATYVLVVALLGAVYFGSVALVTTMVDTESGLAVAVSTLAVAALFNPVRRRIQRWIDRRFNRARYDAQEVMDAFAASLRDRLDANELSLGWRDVVTETIQPSAVSVWIREGRR